MMSKCCKKFW